MLNHNVGFRAVNAPFHKSFDENGDSGPWHKNELAFKSHHFGVKEISQLTFVVLPILLDLSHRAQIQLSAPSGYPKPKTSINLSP